MIVRCFAMKLIADSTRHGFDQRFDFGCSGASRV
jgi:hypothetical protein